MQKRILWVITAALIISLIAMGNGGARVSNAQGGTPAATASASDPLGGATTFAKADQATDVNVMLDWVPNTNHLGLYIAQAKGYYKEANLNVTIQPAGDVQVEQVVALNKAQFGISYEEQASYSIAKDVPIVSVAAIIQHNTSGFATLADKSTLKTPADLVGKKYGSFGSAIEKPIINSLIACAGGKADSFEMVDIGYSDPFPLMQKDQIDFVWLFYAWSAIQAEQQGTKLSILMLKDYTACVPDYYTPILITNTTMINEHPDVVRAFVQATARGYADAIRNPSEAADILLKAVPDLDANLVKASAAWLADQFQADAPRWGEQKTEIWQAFSDYMLKNKALDTAIDVSKAFSNAFLPGSR